MGAGARPAGRSCRARAAARRPHARAGGARRGESRYAQVEQVKRFAILGHDLSQEAGELTPTLKVKRNIVYDRYVGIFDDLYVGIFDDLYAH
ncbi:MAG: hypothetical protein ACXVHJ_32955 [Solirubrobacteraceae bacterium]